MLCIFDKLIVITLLFECCHAYYTSNNQNRPQINEEPLRTRSLAGGYATNGNNITNGNVLELMKVGLLGGYAIRRIKMFNDRIYLARYRRSYWFGTRYYAVDNRYFLDTRDTCAYRMNETERDNIEYEEDGEPILDVIYQCQRHAQYCCGLDCCLHINRRGTESMRKNEASTTILNIVFPFLLLSSLIIVKHIYIF